MCIPHVGRSKYGSLWERLIANSVEEQREYGWADCWHWTGNSKCRYGYGRFNFWVPGLGISKMLSAHLSSWLITEAHVPTSNEFYLAYLELKYSPYELHHLCHNTGCINPDHLELLTPKENCAARRYY